VTVKPAVVALVVVLGIGAAAGSVFEVVRLARRERAVPVRCGAGLVAVSGRCCAPGQQAVGKRCVGEPTACPPGLHVAESRNGCVADARRVPSKGGPLSMVADDWQTEAVPLPKPSVVAPFSLDATEVTFERWQHCVLAGACRSLESPEPGVPVVGIDPKEAEKFCRFEGGRLPWSEEWVFAAAGKEGRRFPWGPTGLVCRRAAFGLVNGPCASGGALELAGTRPDGATPEGILDLSGNAAEWTLERDGRAVARGGSFRSESAADLESWSVEAPPAEPRDVGFRCAHDAEAVPPH
jgi:formylglycine-generating enzyme required for sulfatase activity